MATGSPYDFFTPRKRDPYASLDFTGGRGAFDPLPSSAPNMGPTGSLVRGTSGSNPSGALQTGPGWWDTNSSKVGGATSAFLPLLVSLFGNNPYKDKAGSSADALSQLADLLTKKGEGISDQGQQALHPVIQYLMALTGADPAALAQATQPERARVLDQYDTARKALQFLPRGGGQASATMEAGAKSASDISSIIANARTQGVGQLGSLGKGLLDTGISTLGMGGQARAAAGSAYESLSKHEDATLGGFGEALGTAISTALMFL